MRPWAATAIAACLACGGTTPAPPPATETPSPRQQPETPRQPPRPEAQPSASEAAATDDDPPAEADEPAGDALPPPRVHLGLGGEFSCAVDPAETVWCWGSNRFGQLGDPALEVGARSKRSAPAPVAGVRSRRVAVGVWHVCALRPEGTVACWGHNGWGQLGDGSREDRSRPVDVVGLRGVVEIAAGLGHTCARTADRRLYCWGQNEHGQLGDGSYELRTAPTPVPIEEVVAVVAGRAHTCALDAGGAVSCWGENLDGQLGDGSRSEPDGHRPTPAPVAVAGATSLAAGPGATCARTAEEVLCWGRNDSLQLAARPGGRPNAAVLRPTPMGDAGAVAQVALGSRFSCVRDPDGSVRCVGLNHRGQLGDGSRRLRRRLTTVRELVADDLAAGIEHACALRGLDILCWGDNRAGQLGVPELRLATSPTLALSFRSADAAAELPTPPAGEPARP